MTHLSKLAVSSNERIESMATSVRVKMILVVTILIPFCLGVVGDCQKAGMPLPPIACNTNYWNGEAQAGFAIPPGFIRSDLTGGVGPPIPRWIRDDTWYLFLSHFQFIPQSIQSDAESSLESGRFPGDEILRNSATRINGRSGWSWVRKSTSHVFVNRPLFTFTVYAGVVNGNRITNVSGTIFTTEDESAWIPLLDTALTLCAE